MKSTSIIISIIASIGLIITSLVLANAYKYKYKVGHTISVTGNAKQDFEADIVKWSATFIQKSMSLSDASKSLKSDREMVRQFLIEKGIKDNEILFSAINISKDFSYQTDANGNSYGIFTGYNLSQNVKIESSELDKVDNASREISDLISKGIELTSNEPSYYYSKLEDLKLSLIGEASLNAKARAANIAKEAGISLGALQKADLGVFQITGQNDNEEYSYGGVFNTTSRFKTANITIKAEYGL